MFSYTQKTDRLIHLLRTDAHFAEIFYKLNVPKYHYTYNDRYPFEHFNLVIKEIDSLNINSAIVDAFQNSLTGNVKLNSAENYSTLTKQEAHQVVKDLLSGKPPADTMKRRLRFRVLVKKDPYNDLIIKLNTLWHVDLKNLLNTSKDQMPNIAERGVDHVKKKKLLLSKQRYQKLINRLHIEAMVDEKLIERVSKDFKQSLRQMYKKNRKKKKQLNSYSGCEIVVLYLKIYLLDNFHTKEWAKSFVECIHTIKKKKKQYRSVQLELTFLDKTQDIFRTLRFSDATRNCLNSNLKNPLPIGNTIAVFKQKPVEIFKKIGMLISYFLYGLSPVKSLAKIYKDPLTFIIDLQEVGSHHISGFVFGRFALNSSSGRPIIMLNSIYTPHDDLSVLKKVLFCIEEIIGKRIKAEAIILPLIHNNYPFRLSGYQVRTVNIKPLAALNNRMSMPIGKTHDDFMYLPHTVNGIFTCTGNYKELIH